MEIDGRWEFFQTLCTIHLKIRLVNNGEREEGGKVLETTNFPEVAERYDSCRDMVTWAVKRGG